jgi:hypothetical protein
MSDIQASDLELVIPYQGEKKHAQVVHFLVLHITNCRYETEAVDASLVLDLMLLLLRRLDEEAHDMVDMDIPSGLALIGMIPAHLSGRTDDLLANVREKSFIRECYKKAVAEL